MTDTDIDYDVRLAQIENTVRMIVKFDLPELPPTTEAILIGHLTGALLVSEMEAHAQ